MYPKEGQCREGVVEAIERCDWTLRVVKSQAQDKSLHVKSWSQRRIPLVNNDVSRQSAMCLACSPGTLTLSTSQTPVLYVPVDDYHTYDTTIPMKASSTVIDQVSPPPDAVSCFLDALICHGRSTCGPKRMSQKQRSSVRLSPTATSSRDEMLLIASICLLAAESNREERSSAESHAAADEAAVSPAALCKLSSFPCTLRASRHPVVSIRASPIKTTTLMRSKCTAEPPAAVS